MDDLSKPAEDVDRDEPEQHDMKPEYDVKQPDEIDQADQFDDEERDEDENASLWPHLTKLEGLLDDWQPGNSETLDKAIRTINFVASRHLHDPDFLTRTLTILDDILGKRKLPDVYRSHFTYGKALINAEVANNDARKAMELNHKAIESLEDGEGIEGIGPPAKEVLKRMQERVGETRRFIQVLDLASAVNKRDEGKLVLWLDWDLEVKSD